MPPLQQWLDLFMNGVKIINDELYFGTKLVVVGTDLL
jgi:hypothetical protein